MSGVFPALAGAGQACLSCRLGVKSKGFQSFASSCCLSDVLPKMVTSDSYCSATKVGCISDTVWCSLYVCSDTAHLDAATFTEWTHILTYSV